MAETRLLRYVIITKQNRPYRLRNFVGFRGHSDNPVATYVLQISVLLTKCYSGYQTENNKIKLGM
jgi:hypothetical protein